MRHSPDRDWIITDRIMKMLEMEEVRMTVVMNNGESIVKFEFASS